MFNSNQASAVATHGPIAYWGVSSITDMAELFNGMTNFNADISGWSTSSVTTMYRMFRVRSARASKPQLDPPRTLLDRSSPHTNPFSWPTNTRPKPQTPQGASAFNQSLSFDTSSVTTMQYMFDVRCA
eukprot:scaffold65740_cov36-Phaeocystis_antarctica.AAC.1